MEDAVLVFAYDSLHALHRFFFFSIKPVALSIQNNFKQRYLIKYKLIKETAS